MSITSMTNPISTLNPMNTVSPLSVLHQNVWMDSGYKEEELISIQLPKMYMEQYCTTLIGDNDDSLQESESLGWSIIVNSFAAIGLLFTMFLILSFLTFSTPTNSSNKTEEDKNEYVIKKP